MNRFAYFPGCSLHGTSNDYETSVRACLGALGAQLDELDDWVCCGATAAHAVNHKLALALPARNLAIAERDGHAEVFSPCPMCSTALLRAREHLSHDPALRQQMSEIVEADVQGKTPVVNLIQVLQRIGVDAIKAAVRRPLEHITAACYYGCLLSRPPIDERFDDSEHPTSMETLVAALGAKTVSWNCQTECCGAGMTMAHEDTVLELSNRILANAAAHGANCLVVACPMCHVNLDMKQADVERRYGVKHALPVYYLSDIVGMALGLSDADLAIDRHFAVKA